MEQYEEYLAIGGKGDKHLYKTTKNLEIPKAVIIDVQSHFP